MKKLAKFLKSFRKDESGAVTVDWVVLTVGVIGLGTILYPLLNEGVKTGGTKIQNQMSK